MLKFDCPFSKTEGNSPFEEIARIISHETPRFHLNIFSHGLPCFQSRSQQDGIIYSLHNLLTMSKMSKFITDQTTF